MGIENIEVLFPYDVPELDEEVVVLDALTETILEPMN